MFCQVIIDIAHANVDRLFTYRIPVDMPVQLGSHILVPFGAGNTRKEGFVVGLTETAPPTGVSVKDVLSVSEPYTVLLEEQLSLAQWMQSAYNCLLVDALRLMIPAQLRGGRVKEKTVRTVRIAEHADISNMRKTLLKKDGTPRAPKQLELFDLLANAKLEMSAQDVLAFVPNGQSALSALIRRGYVTESGHVTFRRPAAANMQTNHADIALTDAQQNAIAAIEDGMRAQGGTFLLHGVTGSGKTEVYMHAISRCLRLGRQAIMLVPEIALTPQTVGLFCERFDDRVAVLHSRLSVGERFDEWRRIRLGKADVVVGARSAVFAPLNNIGLIIIDEEHESSYQSETSPRYHALDVAAHRAAVQQSALVLGSATPSLTSYFRAESGRYRLLELPDRVMHRPMPKVEIVDMREEFLHGNNGIFSARMVKLLKECLDDGKQAMLFLNRRGYSTFVSCRACGYVVECPNCDLSMTYHKGENRLRCHYCGHTAPLPSICPACGKRFIKYFGVGTEQVEEQLHRLFPDAVAIRMDTDTTRTKDAMQQMLSAFSRGEAQVLIGTQMIAKGHDFPNVTLVGVIAADATLCIPDYRSTERTFQLLTQVSGRAGRDESPGRVVVQTYSPSHPAIRYAREHDYKSFFRYELAERRKALFPPYSLFVRILFSGTDEEVLEQAVTRYAELMKAQLTQCIGPELAKSLLLYDVSYAPIKRKQGLYRYQILVKLLRTKTTAETIRCIYAFAQEHRNELFAMVEINPQDML